MILSLDRLLAFLNIAERWDFICKATSFPFCVKKKSPTKNQIMKNFLLSIGLYFLSSVWGLVTSGSIIWRFEKRSNFLCLFRNLKLKFFFQSVDPTISFNIFVLKMWLILLKTVLWIISRVTQIIFVVSIYPDEFKRLVWKIFSNIFKWELHIIQISQMVLKSIRFLSNSKFRYQVLSNLIKFFTHICYLMILKDL